MLTVAALYLVGAVAQKLWNWPGPVVMLGLAVLIKLGRVAPPSLERGAYANYQFFSACVTYPLLFAIGVAKTPWEKLIAAFNAPTVVTIVALVATLVGTGFAVRGSSACIRSRPPSSTPPIRDRTEPATSPF